MPYRAPSGAATAAAALTLAIALFALLAARPATAAAQGYTCEASAFAVTIGPSPREEPITANKGQPTCQAASAGGNPPASPLPITGSLLSATTSLEGPAGDPRRQTATASGGVGELKVAGLPIPLERPDLSQLPGPQTIPGVGTIDVRAAVEALVPASASVELLSVRALRAQVTGTCVDGSPRLASTFSIAGITVLGQELATDKAVSRALTVADTASIDPSNLTLEQLGLPGVTLDPAAAALLAQVLDALPTISIPATVARVSTTPGRRIEGGGSLTQRALELSITLAGQNLVDLTVGEATVGAAQVNCGGVADTALQCTARPIVLIDVLRRNGRVRLFGAASRRFAGRRVRIRLTANGKTVARPKVRNSGLFRATAKLPPRRIRNTNRARYVASISRQKSFRLKLVRRMLITSTATRGGDVVISGRVVRPLARPAKTVIVQRRLSCGRYKVIMRFKPRRNGRFRVTLPGPSGSQAAVYRMRTKVPKFSSNPKLYPTFTLPRFVDLT